MGKMVQKSIAAFVLATLGWLSLPVTFESAPIQSLHSSHQQASPAQDHSCCPQRRTWIPPDLFVAVTYPAMPCGAQHPCCVKQRPASPSSIPVQRELTRRAAARTSGTSAARAFPDHGRVVEASVICLLPPPFERSTVLRI